MRAGRRVLVRASVGVVALLVLGEAACRIVERSRCRTYCALTCDPHLRWGWWHTPGAAGTCQLCAGGRPVWRAYARYDARGLRAARDVATTPAPGTFRILVLGDSYTEGLQVEAPWPRRLERRLNRDASPVLRYEVLNAAVAGWSVDNALLYLRDEGWRYRPDLVLYAFDTGNDVFENDHDLIRAGPFPYPAKPWFALEGDRLVLHDFPLPAEPWSAWLARRGRRVLDDHSALGRGLLALAARVSVRPARASSSAESVPRMGQNYLAATVPEWRRAWRLTAALLAALRAEVERRGARFAVVVVNGREEVTARWRWQLDLVPAFRALPHDFDKPNRLLTRFLSRRGIPFVPLLAPFRARFGATGMPGFLPAPDIHWAPAGHALAARVVARALRAQALVGATPSPVRPSARDPRAAPSP